MSSQIELAWSAGFFDGEGCAGISRSATQTKPHYQYLKLAVSQTDSEPIRRFFAAVGIGTVNGPYPPKGRFGRKEFWIWQASGAKAEAVFALLRPYLSGPKCSQILATLNIADLHNIRRGTPAPPENREEV